MRQAIEILGVEDRGTKRVAVIANPRTGDPVRIYRKGSRWRYYASDAPVRDRKLIRAARKALGEPT